MIRLALEKDHQLFNKLARHPLQSWEWGVFRANTGVDVLRLIKEEKSKAIEVFQITLHRIPKTGKFIGYCPKSSIPDEELLTYLQKFGKQKGLIFVKFEPNEEQNAGNQEKISELSRQFKFISGKPLFTKFTFQLDISKTEDALLQGMHQKTRYNLRLAEKKGVSVVLDNSLEGFEEYWKLTEETTIRQHFYAHSKKYHRLMWETMVGSGIGNILKAVYQGKTLSTWVLFELNGVLYYPYGASSTKHRDVMASNLIMWEAIRFGKKKHCRLFDMWGSLGPVPDEKDPWFGFHRFKQGYGGNLIEFIGSYDLIIDPIIYPLYGLLDKLRWSLLKLKTNFRK